MVMVVEGWPNGWVEYSTKCCPAGRPVRVKGEDAVGQADVGVEEFRRTTAVHGFEDEEGRSMLKVMAEADL